MGMDMNALMKQAQKMQEKMQKIQEELVHERIEETSGGGMVRVVVNGHQEIIELQIKPDAVNPDDVELLEDMILVALRNALAKSQELAKARMAEVTGGLKIPGMM
jgi:DNA-binding YbaB/EbfC family protein